MSELGNTDEKAYKSMNFIGIVNISLGIVGMASLSMISGLATLLKKDNLSKGVEITIENNEITAELHIIVAYGVSISAVADNLIENVKYKVEEFTGMKVKNIFVYVEGVRVVD